MNDANAILTRNEKQTQLETGRTRNHFTAETSSSLVLDVYFLMDAPKDPSASSKIVSMIFSILLSCCAVLLLIGCVIRTKQRRALARVHFTNECPPVDARGQIFTVDSFDKDPPSYESVQHLSTGTVNQSLLLVL